MMKTGPGPMVLSSYTVALLSAGHCSSIISSEPSTEPALMVMTKSFPSAHAARAFYPAWYIHQRYGFKQSIPYLAAATYVVNRIIVSNIFGKTPALENLCQELTGTSLIVDPYQGRFMDFSSEAGAYACFTSTVRLNHYAEALQKKVSKQQGSVELLGFSVGASAIWLLSEILNADRVTRATCFYGSQIRHSCHLSPRFPIHLILPSLEVHFSVQELAGSLAQKKHVEIHHSRFLHGFMNRQSTNFNPGGYRQYAQWLSSNHQDSTTI